MTDNVRQFPNSAPFAAGIADDVLLSVSFEIAKGAVEKTPEQMLRMIDEIHSRLLARAPLYSTLDVDAQSIIIASVFYFAATRMLEIAPQVRASIDVHMATCDNHAGHALRVKLDESGKVK